METLRQLDLAMWISNGMHISLSHATHMECIAIVTKLICLGT
jgi:hypothetical protein